MGSRTRSAPSSTFDFPKIAFGPGDCVCTDFADPRRLSGSNLPPGLSQLLADWIAAKPDPYSDSESSSSKHPNDSDSSRRSRCSSPVRRRTRSHSRRRSRSHSRRSSDASDDELIIRRPVARSGSRGRRLSNGTSIRVTSWTSARGVSEQSKISCLAFGSRVGEFAIIYQEKGRYYLDGNIFARLSVLQDWLVPNWTSNKPIKRAPISAHNGASLRLFLGAEGSYFVYDRSSGKFCHNIETREFRDWLSECLDRRLRTLRKGYAPHSLTLGPNNMFCWICDEGFKVNDAFRETFPSVEPFLLFSKRKKMLNQVMFTASTEHQSGSNQAYFVLSTSGGVCLSSVPADASDLVSKYTVQWGAIRSARRAKEIKRLTQDGTKAKESLDSLTSKLSEMKTIVNVGYVGFDTEFLNPLTSQIAKTILNNLKLISEDCDKNALLTNEKWAEASLADRVHMLIEDLKSNPTTNGENGSNEQDVLEKLSAEVDARIRAALSKVHDKDFQNRVLAFLNDVLGRQEEQHGGGKEAKNGVRKNEVEETLEQPTIDPDA